MLRLSIFFCFFSGVLHAQNADFHFYGKSIPEIRQSMKTPVVSFPWTSSPTSFPIASPAACAAPTDTDIPLFFTSSLSKWKPQDLPFFCRIEHQMGKKLPMQFKFRLGSVEYVDALEGKR